ncbi:MAG: bis(5'-nucleosyl)-tetraphosphatase (symmetrical) YqeK [Peptoniphilaceae bacterium]|nr:bis(5'-nucleosyl)-tetraphosphatase (symmetrical) YqeK [Peptoniphilaceae bacterium]MDY6019597.1 bis(5'-nucleosyl)-tetraphosphatase (symmetrical) YqeK [Anaerococcus sp.]
MFDLTKYEDRLREKIGDKRFNHSLRVYQTALEINDKIDEEKIREASLLHDCAKYNEKYYLDKYKDKIDFSKDIINNKFVLHAFLGSIVAKQEYSIEDEEVLDAIRFHTTARPKMTKLDKIIFLADSIEPNRSYPGVIKLRELAHKNLDQAVLFSLNATIKSLIDRNIEICRLTIDARNYLIKEKDE